MTNELSNGDLAFPNVFRVRLPDGRLETFRLYYIDTTESRSRGKRSDEQAAYFGLTRKEAVQEEWRSNSRLARYYAIVLTAGGRDLNELLVRAGLARIYGTRAPLPDGRDSRMYLALLAKLENEAKAAKRGGWGMYSIGRSSQTACARQVGRGE